MNWRIAFVAATFLVSVGTNRAQTQTDAPTARQITLQEAVALALMHNHNVRISAYLVEEKEQSKEIARSRYFPTVRNESQLLRVTDSQFIQFPVGSLGTA